MIAPAKLNLCLYLGPVRADGLHELCSLFAPLALADRLTATEAERDEVRCPGVEQPDLSARALASLRQAGWRRPPLLIEVDKRIPVAAGLGGGSADAAAVLRLAGEEVDGAPVRRLAAALGADVPSQLDPRFALVGGAGERVTPLPEPEPFFVVLVPAAGGLRTADVYAEADRLGLARPEAELERLRGELLGATATGASPLSYPDLLVNDLAEAAISLQPPIEEALAALRAAGAAIAIVTGSGPTAAGLFAERAAAEAAGEELAHAGRQAIVSGSGMDA